MIPAEDDLPLRGTALLTALVACLLLFRLGDVPLVGPDEPRYARVAVEMHRSHDVVTPTLLGQPWLEKPPLYYWMAVTAMTVLGENESAARLPSVFAGLGWVLALTFVGTRLYGRRAGLHAGFVLGTSLLGFFFARAAAMDLLLAACVTGAVGLFGLVLLERAGTAALMTAYGLTALAVLAKGPLGALLPALVLAGFVAVQPGRAALLRRLLSWRGLGLFLLVVAPWHIVIARRHGALFADEFLVYHNLERFFSTVHQHPGAFYYYLPVLLGGLFPWTGLLLPALWHVAPRSRPADRFVLVWVALPLVFFSLAGSKLPGYILPCLPPLALLIGRRLAEALEAQAPRPQATLLRIAALVGLAAGALVAAAPLVLLGQGEASWPLLIPAGLWSLVTTFLFSRRVTRDLLGAVNLLRVGAIGLLLLLAQAAPTVLGRLESGRDLFALAQGEEVLVWGARRTVWMSGYFYNQGQVRELRSLDDVLTAAAGRWPLVLCGPKQRERLEATPLDVQELGRGPRGATLIRLGPPRAKPVVSRVASPS